MSRVTFKLFNVLADYAGTRQVELELPDGANVLDALKVLCSSCTPGFEAIVLPGGRRGAYLKVFLNGDLFDGIGEESILTTGDELMLFPAVAGGSAWNEGA